VSEAKPTKGLGRGFEALIPQNFDASLLLDEDERIQKLKVSNIHPNPDQPRKHFDEQAINELAESIKRYGIIQPLVVSPDESGYILIAGERRWRASQQAGLDTVPAIVRTEKELRQLEIALVENVQRVDLDPNEQAISIQRQHDQINISYSDTAQRLGKAETTINNIVRLLQLPENIRAALQESKISEGHARAILSLKEFPDKQQELLKLIVDNGWSVRQAEQYVTAHKTGARTQRAARNRLETTSPATERLSQLVKSPVTIRRTAKGGKLEIGFKGETEMNKILARLVKALQQN
jgi:ParB family chromosome partitioning protein